MHATFMPMHKRKNQYPNDRTAAIDENIHRRTASPGSKQLNRLIDTWHRDKIQNKQPVNMLMFSHRSISL